MSDSRWDGSLPEVPYDADIVTFAVPPSPKRRRRWIVTAAFVAGVVAGAALMYVARPDPAPAEATRSTATTGVPELILPTPLREALIQPSGELSNPNGTYQATCVAEPDPSTGPTSGPRYEASMVLANTGNVGQSYQVTVIWRLPDGNDVTRSIRQDVPPGVTRRALLVAPAPAAAVSPDQRAPSGATCTTMVTLLGIFSGSYH